MKKLYRSSENKVISGVIGGLGDYFQVDPVLLRLIFVVVVVFTGVVPGIVVYLLATLVVPLHPSHRQPQH